MSNAGWAFASALGAFAVVVIGIVAAESGTKASSPPSPNPTPPGPTPPKLPPAPLPGIQGKWQRLTPSGATRSYTIPAGATFAVTMQDGIAPRALMQGIQTITGMQWTTIAPGTMRPSDWPSDDPESALALRGFGTTPIPLTINAEIVAAVWQIVPAVAAAVAAGAQGVANPIARPPVTSSSPRV